MVFSIAACRGSLNSRPARLLASFLCFFLRLLQRISSRRLCPSNEMPELIDEALRICLLESLVSNLFQRRSISGEIGLEPLNHRVLILRCCRIGLRNEVFSLDWS